MPPKPDKEIKPVNVLFSGEQIVLPAGMTYEEAATSILKKRDDESTIVSVSEKINAFPLDGAVALCKALKERYGWATLAATPTFWGPKPPQMIGVEVGYNETIQVPWGRFTVPNVSGYMETSWTLENGMPVFMLHAEVQRQHERVVNELAKRIREIVAKESIYSGKAIKINFRDSDGERKVEFDPSFKPRFLDLNRYNAEQIVYAAETEATIVPNLFNPVRYTDLCRKNNIPLKRGILLEGRYGTGKTLTAYHLAKVCVENDWTFVYVEDVRDLDMAIAFARMYGPCVLFAEDVDRTMPNGPRTSEIDRILNTLDGIESKKLEVMTVLTTNHVMGIHSGFLRPGRIDTVVKVLPPDDQAMLKLVRYYGKTKDGRSIVQGDDQEIIKAIAGLRGSNAAFVQEAVERAKLSAVSKLPVDGEMTIRPDDLKFAADSMESHIKMVCPDAGKEAEDDAEQIIDPVRLASSIMMDQIVHAFISKITNPKQLEKIIVKAGGGQRRRGASPGPSSN